MKRKLGKIVTFYSFKGGVGRSMSLANVAILLAQWGYKTLIIDWDLEAPGLELFFSEHIDPKKAKLKVGLIDLLTDAASGEGKLRWSDCVMPMEIVQPGQLIQIDIITAGVMDEYYYEKVRAFDFNQFYRKHNGGEFIETMRNEWLAQYDFVLIDSRTGVTDIGGVCTIQLPDILVVLFTPTNQSLHGVINVARRAMAAQRKLPYERLNLLTLPIATRIDNIEYRLLKKWFKTFEVELKEIYEPWLKDAKDHEERLPGDFLLSSKVPYISYFSFGEKLPVLEEGVTNPTGMGFSYQSIASVLATHLNYPKLLVEDRTKLIELAKHPEGLQTLAKPGRTTGNMKYYWLAVSKTFVKIAKAVSVPAFVVIVVMGLFFYYAQLEQRAQYERAVLQMERAERALDSVRVMQLQFRDSLTHDYRSEVRELYNLKSSIKEAEYALRSSKYKSDPQISETVKRLNSIEASLDAMTYK